MAVSTDELFLRQALELAAQGAGLASPNPMVGALVVDERGRIVGRGTHLYEGRKHAEILALEEAGPLARGNTLYLNLEPCSHTGRTGPCADAVVAAGVARVVCSMEDPNPMVAGKGFQRLREAGIEVEVGGLEAEARRLNECFAQFIRTGMPFVTLKSALSLDGKIAGPPAGRNEGAVKGSTTYITGEASRRRVHEMRHASDAILVGVNTILADDPLLTDRSGLARRRPLLRVVVDSRLRLPLESRLVTSCESDLVVFCTEAEERRRRPLEERGVRVVQVEADAPDSRPDLRNVFRELASHHQVTSVLVEGGAAINWSCLRAGLVDKLVLFFAPTIFGPAGGVDWLEGQAGLPRELALRAFATKIERFDEDFAIESYLRDPYRPLESRG
jgi:diaminohydroxyphosphoribosylaminopyrimidine deaminase/5-amino-6-(5-phosphoribosylamino)uracil reductase